MKESMTVEMVAKICHEVNRAYTKAIKDVDFPEWEDAPIEHKNSIIDGVKYVILHPLATAEELHNIWMNYKTATGWTYGEVKDTEKKTHPCMVPYWELPKEEQVKDRLFIAVVRASMAYMPDEMFNPETN